VRSRFVAKLFASFALVVVIGGVLVGLCVDRFTSEGERSDIEESLGSQAVLLSELVAPALRANDASSIEALVARLAPASGTRFTVILPDGRVVADSHEQPSRMKNHSDRPEVIAALREGRGSGERVSDPRSSTRSTSPSRSWRVALLDRAREPAAAGLEQRFAAARRLVSGVLAGTLLALVVAAFVARRATRPVIAMTAAAGALADGEGRPPSKRASDEMGARARSTGWRRSCATDAAAEAEREAGPCSRHERGRRRRGRGGRCSTDQAARTMLGVAPVRPRGARWSMIRQPG
jgi:two-component system phosphate regulon sensor histidine kinase PhoR